MWCRHVRNQLSAYADGELSAAQARVVEEHLVRCEHCAQEHADFRRLARMTATVPAEDVPAGLHARIMTSLAYASAAPVPVRIAPPRRGGFMDAWMLAGLTTATAALVVAAVHQRQPAPAGRMPVDVSVSTAPSQTDRPAPVAAPPQRHETQPHIAAAPPQPHPAPEAQPAPAVEQPAPAPQLAKAEPHVDASPAPASVLPPAVNLVAATARKPPAKAARSEAIGAPRDIRPQPVAVGPPSEMPVLEPKTETSPAAPAQPMMAVMPGDPVVNSSGTPAPVETPSLGGESNPRMAGMAMEMETPAEEDEGLRALRMFLEERNRTVPQPPANPNRDRRPRKNL